MGRSGRVRKNIALTGILSPDRLARSESVYRLSYPELHDISTADGTGPSGRAVYNIGLWPLTC